jgi:heme-degrading monooxygenase HmoA
MAETTFVAGAARSAMSQPVRQEDREPMIYQLRIYEIFPHNRTAFLARFRDHAARIMRSYGFDILAMWEARTGRRLEFVYLLAWPDEETLQRAWERFRADAEWQEIKRVTAAQHGDLVGEIEDRVLVPLDGAGTPAAYLGAGTA